MLVLKLRKADRVQIGPQQLRLDELRTSPKRQAGFSIDRNDGAGFQTLGWLTKEGALVVDASTSITTNRIGVTSLALALVAPKDIPITRLGSEDTK